MNIDSPEIEELTSNQKHDLLFNSSEWKEGVPSNKRRKTKIRPPNLCFAKIKVTQFFQEGKIKIKRFPDSPNHMHSLEESDKVKRSQIIRNLVVQEAIKNYHPPAILNAVKEYASEKMDLVHGALDAHLIGNINKEQDIRESIFFLEQHKYYVERFFISHKSTNGFVFIHPNQIPNLEKFGWLSLINSTHKTNRYDYRLFTLYIRNGYGCWNVDAHFFVSNEDSDTISEALKIVRQFAHQSNIEEKSIKLAFPGLINGEQECETWMHKIYEVDTRKKMTQAMYKWTRIGCEALIREAIDQCPVQSIKQYIKRYYFKNNHQWALWARQHSPLLLQVTSTNALESFHSELKRTTSPQHGIIDEEILQEIHKFPFPVQKMLIEEACAVEKRLEKGKSALNLTSVNCYCSFYHHYLLPCRHIFHEQMYGATKLLTSDIWTKFQRIFEESGFEVYTHYELTEVNISENINKKVAENRRLVVNELMERTHDVYWRMEEKGNDEQTDIFLNELRSCLEPVLNNVKAK
ncbi:hypothetical protein Glove_43g65 [Diversispora epigaea]|uniref:ZSWIM1/3 RNaseH-like domain-containing protein n=1 Tax=Diversispora epigaea TaxID=1348612 RepID=A0A397JEW3_9GLOM|nr:hypothetical protein Glove_43g65 [Diversispora epigaea]